MSLWSYIIEVKYRIARNFVVATAGFFLAFVANSYLDERKEKKTFVTALSAIRAEAASNDAAHRDSFGPLFQDGLVLREFSISAASQALGTSSFVKHASSEQLRVLGEYVRNLALANAFRAKVEAIRFSESYFDETKRPTLKHWEASLVLGWKDNLVNCQKSIAEVLALQ